MGVLIELDGPEAFSLPVIAAGEQLLSQAQEVAERVTTRVMQTLEKDSAQSPISTTLSSTAPPQIEPGQPVESMPSCPS
jgi:hypothetical protein